MKPATIIPCKVCEKRTEAECSHVDCPNRKRITAQPVGSEVMTSASGSLRYTPNGRAIVRRPNLFED